MTLDQLDGRLTCSVPEAGQLLGIGKNAAYEAANRGEIPTLRFGSRLVVPVPRLLSLVGARPPTSARSTPPPPFPSTSTSTSNQESTTK